MITKEEELAIAQTLSVRLSRREDIDWAKVVEEVLYRADMYMEDKGWHCICGYPSLEHALYCSQCGASRVGPIQATEEELQGFIESRFRHQVIRAMSEEPTTYQAGSFVIYRGSYKKRVDQLAEVIHSGDKYTTIMFTDRSKMSTLTEVLEPA